MLQIMLQIDDSHVMPADNFDIEELYTFLAKGTIAGYWRAGKLLNAAYPERVGSGALADA